MTDLPRTKKLPARKLLVNRYLPLDKIGEGGAGEVFKAEDTRLTRIVALKVLMTKGQTTLERFKREAKISAQLQHPNIVRVYDYEYDIDTEQCMLSMEFIEGESLSQLLKREPLSFAKSCQIMLEVCKAVQYAHEKGYIHRDLKPGNVLLDKQGRVLVSDFGLGKALDDRYTKLSHTGAILGTPAYMSPEQARGDSTNPQADVYSLGAMFYEMLTGRIPFDGASPVNILYKLANEEAPSPLKINPNIPKELAGICRKAIAKDLKRRYCDVEAMANDLRRYLGEDVVAQSPSPLPKKQPRQWSYWLAGAGVLLLTVFFSYLFLEFREKQHLEQKNVERESTAMVVWEQIEKGSDPREKYYALQQFIQDKRYQGTQAVIEAERMFPLIIRQLADKERQEIFAIGDMQERHQRLSQFLQNEKFRGTPAYAKASLEEEARLVHEKLLENIGATDYPQRWRALRSFPGKYRETRIYEDITADRKNCEKNQLSKLQQAHQAIEHFVEKERFLLAQEEYDKAIQHKSILLEMGEKSPAIKNWLSKLDSLQQAMKQQEIDIEARGIWEQLEKLSATEKIVGLKKLTEERYFHTKHHILAKERLEKERLASLELAKLFSETNTKIKYKSLRAFVAIVEYRDTQAHADAQQELSKMQPLGASLLLLEQKPPTNFDDAIEQWQKIHSAPATSEFAEEIYTRKGICREVVEKKLQFVARQIEDGKIEEFRSLLRHLEVLAKMEQQHPEIHNVLLDIDEKMLRRLSKLPIETRNRWQKIQLARVESLYRQYLSTFATTQKIDDKIAILRHLCSSRIQDQIAIKMRLNERKFRRPGHLWKIQTLLSSGLEIKGEFISDREIQMTLTAGGRVQEMLSPVLFIREDKQWKLYSEFWRK